MARYKVPKVVGIASGKDRQNPKRFRKEEPRNENPLGDPPADFMADQVDAWKEIQSIAIPGLLTEADRLHVELLASMLADFRRDRDAFPATKIVQLRQCIAQLGMTPVDRMKLAKDPGKDGGNPFDDF